MPKTKRTSVEPPDVQASEYDLGVTSVRLIRVGNIIQIIFSKRLSAALYYTDISASFKKEEEDWKRR